MSHGYATLITPDEYLGSIIKLCEEKEVFKNLSYSGSRAVLKYEMPLNEVVFDFLRQDKINIKWLCQF